MLHAAMKVGETAVRLEIRRTKRRALSSHRWVRQGASRSRSTPHPQVTDQSLFDEHERCSMRRQQWETTVVLELIAHLDC